MVIEHCYVKPGAHQVFLSIRDRMTGLVKLNDTSFTINVASPPVTFTVHPIGRRYFYMDLETPTVEIPGYDIVDYVWDMDNGDYELGKKIKFRYNESRDYHIKLTAIAKSKYTKYTELFSSTRKIEIRENYEMPSKKFTDSLNESK